MSNWWSLKAFSKSLNYVLLAATHLFARWFNWKHWWLLLFISMVSFFVLILDLSIGSLSSLSVNILLRQITHILVPIWIIRVWLSKILWNTKKEKSTTLVLVRYIFTSSISATYLLSALSAASSILAFEMDLVRC